MNDSYSRPCCNNPSYNRVKILRRITANINSATVYVDSALSFLLGPRVKHNGRNFVYFDEQTQKLLMLTIILVSGYHVQMSIDFTRIQNHADFVQRLELSAKNIFRIRDKNRDLIFGLHSSTICLVIRFDPLCLISSFCTLFFNDAHSVKGPTQNCKINYSVINSTLKISVRWQPL